jgi:5-methylcytosine-specific restriction endonuclease McrA
VSVTAFTGKPRDKPKREEARRDAWRDEYDRYLTGDAWYRKRLMVLRRAKGKCEGCGEQPATQVHHRIYPRDCPPGSPDWCRQEKLYHLVALCRQCHEDVHA